MQKWRTIAINFVANNRDMFKDWKFWAFWITLGLIIGLTAPSLFPHCLNVNGYCFLVYRN